ncbi:MAG TPA: hypothetical protein VM578_00690 [Candidatus Saccharimonadales bacterium]|nr:hypothetical protein [Candidatus Saccharimonadales bacterium]
MSNFAPLKNVTRTFEKAVQWLSDHEFEIERSASGTCRVTKYGCVAEIGAAKDGNSRIAAFPACLVAGEPAVLLDRGYQKFLKTGKLEIAATSLHLENLHHFSEELKEALGYTSLYNESLGTVSGSYRYDRVADRDLAEPERPARPWNKQKSS